MKNVNPWIYPAVLFVGAFIAIALLSNSKNVL